MQGTVTTIPCIAKRKAKNVKKKSDREIRET